MTDIHIKRSGFTSQKPKYRHADLIPIRNNQQFGRKSRAKLSQESMESTLVNFDAVNPHLPCSPEDLHKYYARMSRINECRDFRSRTLYDKKQYVPFDFYHTTLAAKGEVIIYADGVDLMCILLRNANISPDSYTPCSSPKTNMPDRVKASSKDYIRPEFCDPHKKAVLHPISCHIYGPASPLRLSSSGTITTQKKAKENHISVHFDSAERFRDGDYAMEISNHRIQACEMWDETSWACATLSGMTFLRNGREFRHYTSEEIDGSTHIQDGYPKERRSVIAMRALLPGIMVAATPHGKVLVLDERVRRPVLSITSTEDLRLCGIALHKETCKVACGKDGSVSIYDLRATRYLPLQELYHPTSVKGLDFLGDGDSIVTGTGNFCCTLRIWKNGELVRSAQTHSQISSVCANVDRHAWEAASLSPALHHSRREHEAREEEARNSDPLIFVTHGIWSEHVSLWNTQLQRTRYCVPECEKVFNGASNGVQCFYASHRSIKVIDPCFFVDRKKVKQHRENAIAFSPSNLQREDGQGARKTKLTPFWSKGLTQSGLYDHENSPVQTSHYTDLR